MEAGLMKEFFIY